MSLTNPCSDFIGKFKTYFSVISARMMHYAFFNLDDHVVILCNATSQGSAFGDRLTDFNVSELSFHVIKFKDIEFFDNVVKTFSIPKDRIYVLNISKLCTTLSKAPLNELTMKVLDNGDLCVAFLKEGETLDPSTTCIGSVVVNNHVIDSLNMWYDYINSLGTKEHRETYRNILTEYMPPQKVRNFLLEVDITKFGVFDHHYPKVNFIIHDGLSLPNIKTFLKNKPITEYLWVRDNSIFIMFIYQDETAVVRSIRPCVRVIPLRVSSCFDTHFVDLNYKDK